MVERERLWILLLPLLPLAHLPKRFLPTVDDAISRGPALGDWIDHHAQRIIRAWDLCGYSGEQWHTLLEEPLNSLRTTTGDEGLPAERVAETLYLWTLLTWGITQAINTPSWWLMLLRCAQLEWSPAREATKALHQLSLAAYTAMVARVATDSTTLASFLVTPSTAKLLVMGLPLIDIVQGISTALATTMATLPTPLLRYTRAPPESDQQANRLYTRRFFERTGVVRLPLRHSPQACAMYIDMLPQANGSSTETLLIAIGHCATPEVAISVLKWILADRPLHGRLLGALHEIPQLDALLSHPHPPARGEAAARLVTLCAEHRQAGDTVSEARIQRIYATHPDLFAIHTAHLRESDHPLERLIQLWELVTEEASRHELLEALLVATVLHDEEAAELLEKWTQERPGLLERTAPLHDPACLQTLSHHLLASHRPRLFTLVPQLYANHLLRGCKADAKAPDATALNLALQGHPAAWAEVSREGTAVLRPLLTPTTCHSLGLELPHHTDSPTGESR